MALITKHQREADMAVRVQRAQPVISLVPDLAAAHRLSGQNSRSNSWLFNEHISFFCPLMKSVSVPLIVIYADRDFLLTSM